MSRTLAFPPCFALEPRRLARGKLQHGAMSASSTPSSLSKTADNPPLKTPANRQEPTLGRHGRSHTDLGRKTPPAPGRPELLRNLGRRHQTACAPFPFPNRRHSLWRREGPGHWVILCHLPCPWPATTTQLKPPMWSRCVVRHHHRQSRRCKIPAARRAAETLLNDAMIDATAGVQYQQLWGELWLCRPCRLLGQHRSNRFRIWGCRSIQLGNDLSPHPGTTPELLQRCFYNQLQGQATP